MGKLRVLLVHAHPNPASLCSALKDTCISILSEAGHEIKVTDLYALNLFMPLTKEDFTSLGNPEFFKPQMEQKRANKKSWEPFIPELKAEHEKLSWCNLLILTFPLQFSFFPGIMKNWIDRVFSYGFAYGWPHSLSGRKAIVIYTANDSPSEKESESYVHHVMNCTVFGFCKLKPLDPVVVYADEKTVVEEKLKEVKVAIQGIEKRLIYNSPYAKSSCLLL